MTKIDDAFAAVIGLPCWLVKKVHGSIISMEFGEPHLNVGKQHSGLTLIDGVPKRLPQRLAVVRGDYTLAVEMCVWQLVADGAELAHCESDDLRMTRALRVLSGQALTSVAIDDSDGRTTFGFDLGMLLLTQPAEPGVYEEPATQWWLSMPSNKYVVLRNGPEFSIHDGHAEEDQMTWIRLL
jgi:hypothetical protein